jgi:hypothetical protein
MLTAERHALIGVTAAGGGVHVDGLLDRMDEETLRRFQWKFLGA